MWAAKALTQLLHYIQEHYVYDDITVLIRQVSLTSECHVHTIKPIGIATCPYSNTIHAGWWLKHLARRFSVLDRQKQCVAGPQDLKHRTQTSDAKLTYLKMLDKSRAHVWRRS
eukprot:scaffold14545_cov37-Prasinocladus_malaysianus.AAC.1